MLKKLAVFKYAMLFGALLTFGIITIPQAEARTNKAICKTVKGPVYIARSLTKSKFLAYSKCARYRKNGWQFLRRKVRCVKRYRKGKRIYRCRCIARLCKPKKAALSPKAEMSPKKEEPKKEMKAAPVPVKKPEMMPKKAEGKKPPVSTKKSDQEEIKKAPAPKQAPKEEMKKEAPKAEMKKEADKPAPEKKATKEKPADKKPGAAPETAKEEKSK